MSPSSLLGAPWPQAVLDNPLSLDASSGTLGLDHTTGTRNIYKFGGTSVGSPERLCGLVRIIRAERSRIIAVVVSAMGDTTDYLLEAVDFAAKGDQDRALTVVDQLQQLSIHNAHETQRILQTEHGLGEGEGEIEDVTALVVDFFKPLRELLFGICLLQEKTTAALDTVLSFGERISATIVAVTNCLYTPARCYEIACLTLPLRIMPLAETAHACRHRLVLSRLA